MSEDERDNALILTDAELRLLIKLVDKELEHRSYWISVSTKSREETKVGETVVEYMREVFGNAQ